MRLSDRIFALFFGLVSLVGFGQENASRRLNLEWQKAHSHRLQNGSVVSIPTIEGQFFDGEMRPTYVQAFPLQSNEISTDYQIEKAVFSSVERSFLGSIRPEDLPSGLEAETEISYARGKAYLTLKLFPLLNVNGRLQRLESFELVPSGSRNAAKVNTLARNTFKSNSVLAQGTWFKFAVDTTGVYAIDRNFLRDLGLDPDQISPDEIRIFGNGGQMLPQANAEFRYDDLEENAILVTGAEDGRFDQVDRIIFYAEGPDRWFEENNSPALVRHQTNLYSDQAFYFITVDQGQGLRINDSTPTDQNPDETLTFYDDFQVHELEEVNLFANGQQWLGEDLALNPNPSFSFDLSGLISGEQVRVRVRAVARSSSATRLEVLSGGTAISTLNFRGLQDRELQLAIVDDETSNTLVNGETLNLSLNYDNSGNPSSQAFLDYIEVISKRRLNYQGGQINFRNLEGRQEGLLYRFDLDLNSTPLFLWEVSNPRRPVQKSLVEEAGQAYFTYIGNGQNSFVMADAESLKSPTQLNESRVENQNLHALNDLDYLIIAPEFLGSEAQRLAEYHSSQEGRSSRVVDLEEIYNEFASGSPDLTAIRDFVRMLYQRSPNKKPQFLCLFGDASFDFKDRINDNNNIVPAFQSFESFNLATGYVTDDYFGMMDENEGELKSTDMQDVATGRFPVSTVLEAKNAVDKTLSYYSSSAFGDWRNTITFVADDPDTPDEFVLQETVEQIAQEVEAVRPEFNLKKIYSDAFQQESTAGGERYPTVNRAIDNAMEAGTLVMDYFGHGGVNGWANERILEVPQVQSWNHPNFLPLFITVTCEYARFDNPIRPTAGEYTFWSTQGGAINMISTTREIFISVGQVFNRTFFELLFDPEYADKSVSEVLMLSKHAFGSVQRLFVYSFGDPAMPLAIGRPDVVLTEVNDKEIEAANDTLKALSRIKLTGQVRNASGQLQSNFNGTLSATIFDKALDKTTLDNDNFGRKMEFTAIESKIFKGRASVVNGVFDFEFVVPKDIRIAYGNAKISFYAENAAEDKAGAEFDLIVGGIDSSAPDDQQGPEIALFMNDESFIDGGNTSSSPLLYAKLEDPSGINTSITSVDHDIVAILDGDDANPIVLNDYYETDLDDFTKGKVKFQLKDLETGPHNLEFKCWDTYNNPSESTLSFIVVNDNDLILSNVLNYPNPFVSYTEFWFNHNKPNEPLEVQVQIFTVSGKLVRTLHQSVQTEGLLSRDVRWDGLDDFGNKIGKGVYVYKLHVRSSLSNAKAEKFEKLVILQ